MVTPREFTLQSFKSTCSITTAKRFTWMMFHLETRKLQRAVSCKAKSERSFSTKFILLDTIQFNKWLTRRVRSQIYSITIRISFISKSTSNSQLMVPDKMPYFSECFNAWTNRGKYASFGHSQCFSSFSVRTCNFPSFYLFLLLHWPLSNYCVY